jgi:hypothetical protein
MLGAFETITIGNKAATTLRYQRFGNNLGIPGLGGWIATRHVRSSEKEPSMILFNMFGKDATNACGRSPIFPK